VGGSSLSCPPDAHPGTRRHLPSAASTRPITSKQKPLDIHTSFNMRYPRHMDRGCDSEDGKGDYRYVSLRLTSLGPTAPPPGPESGPVPPGHSILTASFATRGPRVQIPPAPQLLVRALSAISNVAACMICFVRCPANTPQDACPEHLAG
jgi:hypothetical protein